MSTIMTLSARFLLRRVATGSFRSHSTIAEAAQINNNEPIETFRTNENNPLNHTMNHLNRFYTMSPATTQKLFQHGGLPKRFQNQINTFLENSLLIREPALEIISYLRQTDYSRPVNKYVLYGDIGCGKSLTVAHILHFGLESKKLLFHIPWVADWFRRPKEVAVSQTKEGFYDLPVDAAAWLVHFKHQNTPLLAELDLRLTKNYVWNPREQNAAGSPLIELIDFGVARAKYACEIVDALVNEIKSACTAGKCNALVAIDGYNSFLGDDTNIKNSESKKVNPDKITLTQSIFNLVKYDWNNGAIVLAVDQLAVRKEHQSIYPRYLLGKEGFEHLDPFLPVEVPNYTKDQFDVTMEYYKNRKWVREITDNGQRELELLSNRNPYKLMRYTAPL